MLDAKKMNVHATELELKIELENLTVAYEKLNVIAFFFQNFKSTAVHLPLFSGLLLISLTVLNVL